MPAKWSPEINLGAIVQAATLVVMVGGGTLTAYLALRSDINDNRRIVELAIAATQARVLVLENLRPAEEDFRRETRQSLIDLLKGVAQLQAAATVKK